MEIIFIKKKKRAPNLKLIIIQKFKRKIQELYLSPYHYYKKNKIKIKLKKKKKKGNLQILQVTFCKFFFFFFFKYQR